MACMQTHTAHAHMHKSAIYWWSIQTACQCVHTYTHAHTHQSQYCTASHTNSAVTRGGRREAALIIIQRQTKFDKRLPPHPNPPTPRLPSLPICLSLPSFTLPGPFQWSLSTVGTRRSAFSPPPLSLLHHHHLHLWDKTLALDFQQQQQQQQRAGAAVALAQIQRGCTQWVREWERKRERPAASCGFLCEQARVHGSPCFFLSVTHRPGADSSFRRKCGITQ